MIEHARRAGDRSMELQRSPGLAICAQLGPMPVPEAIAVVERVLAELEEDRKSEANGAPGACAPPGDARPLQRGWMMYLLSRALSTSWGGISMRL